MKKIIVILFCIVQSFLSFGQYFNNSYDFSNNIDGALNIETVGSNFLIFSGTRNNNNQYLGINGFRIDQIGQFIDSNILFINNSEISLGWANSIDRTYDSNLILGGGMRVDTFYYGYLVKYNKYGDTLWTKEFGDTIDFYTFRQARQAHDGGYVAVGESSYPSGTNSDGWLLKTDSVGNKEWEKFYGQLSQTERLTSVFPTHDGGYILGGLRRHLVGWPYLNNYDPILIKVDSMGIEEWNYVHDTPYDDGSAYAIQTLDNNYVFASSVSSPDSGKRKAALIKVSATGNLMWEKTYGNYSLNHSLQVVKELPDSNLIAAGYRDQSIHKYGLMVKAQANGDSIFVQTYENDPNGPSNQNHLWDVIPMHDGGFMAVGEVLGVPPAVPFRQDAWVIRVDSMGCILANCLVGVENKEKRIEKIELYPNPTNAWVNLESTEPLNSIEVYNLQGQKVLEVKPTESQFELPQESGLYLVRMVTESGAVVIKKVVKR